MHLEEASLEPPNGLLEFLVELGDGENGFMGTPVASGQQTLAAYLAERVDMAAGRNLPPGWVPMTTYWLLDDAGRLTGMAHLRHRLTPALREHGGHIGYYVRPSERGKGYGTAILRLTLTAARRLGIASCLLTVDAANTPSVRLIEANGGRLEAERFIPEAGRQQRYYWID